MPTGHKQIGIQIQFSWRVNNSLNLSFFILFFLYKYAKVQAEQLSLFSQVWEKGIISYRVAAMAGLQYNFFPTDFFYPRTSKPAFAATAAADTSAAAEKASSLPSQQQYHSFPADYLHPPPVSQSLIVNNSEQQRRPAPIRIRKRDAPAPTHKPGASLDKSE